MTDTNAPLSDAEWDKVEDYTGCGDGLCVVGAPKVFRTLGRCDCLSVPEHINDPQRTRVSTHLYVRRRQVAALLKEVRRLRAEIAALRKGQCDCEHCVCHREHERPCHCMNDE